MTASLFIDAWFMRYLDTLQAIEFKKFVFFLVFLEIEILRIEGLEVEVLLQ